MDADPPPSRSTIPRRFTSLIVGRYFAKEQQAIDALATELETVAAQLTELEEEHGGEDGAFSELDKVSKINVTARLREIKGDKEAKEEAAALNAWLKLATEEADLKKRLKDAEAALDAKAYAKYPKLTEAEIQTLVVAYPRETQEMVFDAHDRALRLFGGRGRVACSGMSCWS